MTRKNKTIKNKIKYGHGVREFVKEVAENIIFSEKKPKNTQKEYNKTYETIVTPDSNIEYKVFFVTPQTFVFNNINSTRVPTFIINGEVQNLKIKNRYVNYLVKINDIWYAILRIVFALNTSFFASYTYTIFYKLKDVIEFEDYNNSITINENKYDRTKEFTLGIFKGTSKTMILKKETYEPITKKNGDIFLALRKFRNVQLESFAIKQDAAEYAADDLMELAI